jgi:hypothetical protein
MKLQLPRGECTVDDALALQSSVIAEQLDDLGLALPLDAPLLLPLDVAPAVVALAFECCASESCADALLLSVWPACDYLGLPIADNLRQRALRLLRHAKPDALGLLIRPDARLVEELDKL